MTHRTYRRIDLRVKCPYCAAPPDYWCQVGSIKANTHYAWEPHAARARAADDRAAQLAREAAERAAPAPVRIA